MPSFTFPATPLAAIWCGLEPYFIDISIDDWYMDKTVLLDKIEELKEEVAIVVPYATFGSWMNLEEYEELERGCSGCRRCGTGIRIDEWKCALWTGF